MGAWGVGLGGGLIHVSGIFVERMGMTEWLMLWVFVL